MNNLESVSIQELLDEIARREELEKENEKPKPKDNIDWGKVLDYAVEQVDYLHENGHQMKDCKTYTWEGVMITVFGDDYFSWHNRQ